MFIKCISNPPTIWINDHMGYADLRFIFEFMYHYVSNGVKKPLIADYFYKYVMSNKDDISFGIVQ